MIYKGQVPLIKPFISNLCGWSPSQSQDMTVKHFQCHWGFL